MPAVLCVLLGNIYQRCVQVNNMGTVAVRVGKEDMHDDKRNVHAGADSDIKQTQFVCMHHMSGSCCIQN